MEFSLKPVKKECHEKISEQMNNSICTIKRKDGKFEIGLFCYMKYKKENIPILLINNYINNDKYNGRIKVSIYNKEIELEIEKIIYKNDDYNISMIKIKEIYNIKYIEIDDKIYENESEIYFYYESMYIMQINNINDIE